MKKIKSILVPLDGSQNSFRALDFAITLAKPIKASITGLHCIDLQLVLEYAVIDPVSIRMEKKAHRFLKTAKGHCIKNRVTFKQKILHGKTSEQILQFSKKGKFDLIVMGSRGEGMVQKMLLGSVSHEITHRSKIPVVIVR